MAVLKAREASGAIKLTPQTWLEVAAVKKQPRICTEKLTDYHGGRSTSVAIRFGSS
jgi:hypothetical protein